jgi:hypothetical protein
VIDVAPVVVVQEDAGAALRGVVVDGAVRPAVARLALAGVPAREVRAHRAVLARVAVRALVVELAVVALVASGTVAFIPFFQVRAGSCITEV